MFAASEKISWKLFLILTIQLILAFFLKASCLTNPWGGNPPLEYAKFCYNDYQALYGVRHLEEKKFPYIQEKPFEYPPLIALQMWVASLFAKDHVGYFYANLPFQVLSLFIALWALSVGGAKHLVWFVTAPPLLLYSFMNWDASTLMCFSLAWACFQKKKWVPVGFFIGLGICGKMYTAFAIPPLLLFLWQRRFPKKAIFQLLWGTSAGWMLLNVPIILSDWLVNGSIEGWLSFFKFHGGRLPEYDSLWHWIAGWFGMSPVSWEYNVLVNRLSSGIFGFGGLALLGIQWRRQSHPWSIFGATLSLLLLVSKIYSPQYALWFLPLFAILKTPAFLMVGFYAADILEFVSRFNWYQWMNVPEGDYWKQWLGISVAGRSFVFLALLLVYSLHKISAKEGRKLPQP